MAIVAIIFCFISIYFQLNNAKKINKIVNIQANDKTREYRIEPVSKNVTSYPVISKLKCICELILCLMRMK